MKRLLSLLISITMICSMLPVGAYAQVSESNVKTEIETQKAVDLPIGVAPSDTEVTTQGAISIVVNEWSKESWFDTESSVATISGTVYNFDPKVTEMKYNFNGKEFITNLKDNGDFEIQVNLSPNLNELELKYKDSLLEYSPSGAVYTRLLTKDFTKIDIPIYLSFDPALLKNIEKESTIHLFSEVGNRDELIEIGRGQINDRTLKEGYVDLSTYTIDLAKKHQIKIYSPEGNLTHTYLVTPKERSGFITDDSDYLIHYSPFRHVTNASLQFEDGSEIDVSKCLINDILRLPSTLFPTGNAIEYSILYSNEQTKESWSEDWKANDIANTPKSQLIVTFDPQDNLENLKTEKVTLKGILSNPKVSITEAIININGVIQTMTVDSKGNFEAPVTFEIGYNVLRILYGTSEMTRSVFCNTETGGVFLASANATNNAVESTVRLNMMKNVVENSKAEMTVKIIKWSADIMSGKYLSEILGESKLPLGANSSFIKTQDIDIDNPYVAYTYDLYNSDGKCMDSYRIETKSVEIVGMDNLDDFSLLIPYFKPDKAFIKIGNGAEIDVTSLYASGIIKVKRDLLAFGWNDVKITLVVGEKTYVEKTRLERKAPVTPVVPVVPVNPNNGGGSSSGSSSGGSSSSGGGGGGSYSAPSAPAGVAAPVVVTTPVQPINVPKALSNVVIEKIDGKQVAKAKLDEVAVRAMLNTPNDKTKNPLIVIPMDSTVDRMTSEFDGKMVQDMGDKKAIIQIKSDKASYSIPLSEISLSSMANKLMLMTPGSAAIAPELVKVNIEVGNAPELAQKAVEKLKLEKGVTVLAQPIEFSIKGSYGNKFVEISEFSTFVERRLAFEGSVAPGETITGIVLEKDGSIRAVPTKIIEENGKKYAVISSMTNSSYSVIKVDSTFSDISKHWAKDSIQAMRSRMIMTGIEQQFNPDKNITRGDLAMAIVKSLGLGKTEGAMLQDLYGDTRAGYIQTAIRYGLVSGYSDYTFRPNNDVSREEAMSMIIKAAKLCGIDVDSLKDVSTYQDTAKISAWAKPAVDKCTQLGLIKGFNGKFEAKNNLTQAEIATILLKLLQKSNLI